MDIETKVCRDCAQAKPLEEFAPAKRRRDGRASYCRACFAVRYRRYREKKAAAENRTVKPRRVLPAGTKYCPQCKKVQAIENFGKNRAARDGLTAYCRPCHNAVGRASKMRLYGGTREYHLRHRYGITSAEVDAMIDVQGGTCAVCPGKPEHVDHDHETGQVRGVLCFNCNQALGNVRDDVVVLHNLAAYLIAHRRRTAPTVDISFWKGRSDLEAAFRHHLAS